MKTVFQIILMVLAFFIMAFGLIFWKYQNYIIEYFKDDYFTDKKVLELCTAGHDGDIKKIDELLAEGVNINHIGKDKVTPLYWLLISKRKTEKTKVGFKYFLERGADPTVIVSKGKRTIFNFAAMYKDPDYLKIILEDGVDDIDLEQVLDARETPLLSANLSGRFENFKMLLDYGANIEWRGRFGSSPLTEVGSSDGWKYSWELLQRGADYAIGSTRNEDGRSSIVHALEGIVYRPSVGAKHGYITDYRKLCIEFLREKGVEVNPWMPDNEKYIKRDEKWILQITDEDGRIKELKLEVEAVPLKR